MRPIINFERRQAVKLGSIELSDPLQRSDTILSQIASRYFFRGGVLRDLVRGQAHNDIDCVAEPKDNKFWQDIKSVIADLPQEGLYYHSTALDQVVRDNIEGAEAGAIFSMPKHIILRLHFTSAGGRTEELDIGVLEDLNLDSPEDIVMTSEAPSSSLVANPQGELWGHPNAFRDIEKNRFNQLAGFDLKQQARSLYRSSKLTCRHSGMTYVPNWKSVAPYLAWQAIDGASEFLGRGRLVQEKMLARWQRSQQVHRLK